MRNALYCALGSCGLRAVQFVGVRRYAGGKGFVVLMSSGSQSGHRPVARRVATIVVGAVALVAAQTSTLPTVAGASTPAPRLAPVLGAAKQGGAVLIWLKDQHKNLNLRSQASARIAAAHTDQRPVVSAVKKAGGTDIVQLVSVNAVAAHVSAAALQSLRTLASVKEILSDGTVTVGDPKSTGPKVKRATITPDRTDLTKAQRARIAAAPEQVGINPFPTVNDCGTLDHPLVEPEALQTINAPAMTRAGLATEPGHGVIVANDGISNPNSYDLVGNPNFWRPAEDGGGSIVVDAVPGDTDDHSDGEYYGDASSIAAQGTVVYQYSQELPYSNMPDNCYFKLVGDAPGASLIDTENIDTPESTAGDKNPATLSESQIIAGIDAAVTVGHADVINESYGYSNSPGSYAIHYAANDAAVDAGVTVVASSGDSGVSGTVSSPASDPKIIAAGATNTHRLNAMAYGFTGWVNNDITPLSSGGPTPEDKVVDLVAPGYGGEAACNPNGFDCPENTQTEAFGGTSQSSPLIAGAAADVIQAYRDSHNGDSPSPALVKQILTGTATDVHAPADEQGAGLLDIGAAMKAAQGMTNSSVSATNTAASLLPTPTQLDLRGNGGSTSFQSVSLYNPNNVSTTVTGAYRELGPQHQIGDVVTEHVSAPDASTEVPVDGAQAAPDISFDVPAGLDRLDADMIWPDPTNAAILSFILTDPTGRLRQISYDYGTGPSQTRAGTVPDIQHVEVANPEAGTWHVQIKWANGRAHLQEPPNLPGTYTGTVSFKVSGQNWITSPASPPVTIGAHRTATIPLQVSFPNAPGDHPESVQFTADDGATTSLPIARRTLIPSAGGEFDTLITSTVGRGIGQISTFNINVPSGRADLGVTLTTPDTSSDDPMTLYMVNPQGTSVATHLANGRTRNGAPLSVQDVNGTPMQTVTYHVPNPMAGTWEIDVELNLTTSGKEFTQTVIGDVLPQAPSITSPTDGAIVDSQTPTVSGTGAAGDTVTVWNGGTAGCTSPVGNDGNWSCTTSTLPAGQQTLTATQADQTNDPSLASNAVTITVPATASVALSLEPAAPTPHEAVTLTATTTNVPDGTTVTFADNGTTLGTGTVSANSATLSLPGGFAVGDHPLTASVPATDTSLAATSPLVDVVVSKTASTIALQLDDASVVYGHAATGSVSVGGANSGTATVTVGSRHVSVPIDGSGAGSFRLPASLVAGEHTVIAVYGGTDDVAASGPASATLTVTRAPTTTKLTLARSTVRHGKSLTVTVQLGGHAAARWPSGAIIVSVSVGNRTTTKQVLIGQAAHGRRTLTVAVPNKTGAGTVIATYPGNANFVSSHASKAVTVV
jgi:hypothetical protein